MIRQTLEEWKQEGIDKFGSIDEIVFECPSCKRQTKVKEFREVTDDINVVYQECLGRYRDDVDCDWTAYGLFGTMSKGRIVITPDGKEVEVFDYGVKAR